MPKNLSTVHEEKSGDLEYSLASRVAGISIEEKSQKKREYMTPANFRQMQSLRSTMLAGKAKTAKQNKSFDLMKDLFNDISAQNVVVRVDKGDAVEKDESSSSENSEEDDPELISRGPIKKPKQPTVHHPYNNPKRTQQLQELKQQLLQDEQLMQHQKLPLHQVQQVQQPEQLSQVQLQQEQQQPQQPPQLQVLQPKTVQQQQQQPTQIQQQQEVQLLQPASQLQVQQPDAVLQQQQLQQMQQQKLVIQQLHNRLYHEYLQYLEIFLQQQQHRIAAAQSNAIEYRTYSVNGNGYECGANSFQDMTMASNNQVGKQQVQPEAVATDRSNAVASPEDAPINTTDSEKKKKKSTPTKEIPDNISDFILDYSRETPTTQSSVLYSPSSVNDASPSERSGPVFIPGASVHGPARTRLRKHLGEGRIFAAMSWLCTRLVSSKELIRQGGMEDEMRDNGLIYWANKHGTTLLHITLSHPVRDIAKAYVIVAQQYKQDPAPRDGLLWDLRDNKGETALSCAVYANSPLFVDFLLEIGSDPNVQSRLNYCDTPLIWAARRGLTDIVKVLLRDPRTDKEMVNKLNHTALMSAVCYNNAYAASDKKTLVRTAEVVRVLLEAGADPTKTDRKGNTIYHIAAVRCDNVLLEEFSRCIPDHISVDQANRSNAAGCKPFDELVKHQGKISAGRYRKCFFALLMCNAQAERSTNPETKDQSGSEIKDQQEITDVNIQN